jgi:sugar phosphate isomerase/epimerase
MRLGVCIGPEQAAEAKAAGFDFFEANVQSLLKGDVPCEEYDKTAPDPAKFALPYEAANCLVPGNHPIVGPGRDLAVLKKYMQRVAKRAKRLGLKVLVFGSGGARRRPDDVDADTASAQIAEFTRLAGEACATHGVTLAIEHLHRQETNTLINLIQTRQLCDQVAMPNVGVLVDSFHYTLEHEPDESILALGQRLVHVHVAEPIKRVEPGAYGVPGHCGCGMEAWDFEHFFSLLQKTGYDQRVSIECSWSKPISVAGADSAAYLRKTWAQAGRAE